MKRNITKLAVLMRQMGYTQNRLAEDLGVSQATVSRIVLGEARPKGSVRKNLCRIFDSGKELFDPITLEETPKQASRRTKEYRQLVQEQRKYTRRLKGVRKQVRDLQVMVKVLVDETKSYTGRF